LQISFSSKNVIAINPDFAIEALKQSIHVHQVGDGREGGKIIRNSRTQENLGIDAF
jgi:hypothetical protein